MAGTYAAGLGDATPEATNVIRLPPRLVSSWHANFPVNTATDTARQYGSLIPPGSKRTLPWPLDCLIWLLIEFVPPNGWLPGAIEPCSPGAAPPAAFTAEGWLAPRPP